LSGWSLKRANEAYDLLDGAGYCSDSARKSADQCIQLGYSWSTSSARRCFTAFHLTEILA
jgi:hypothetical protein